MVIRGAKDLPGLFHLHTGKRDASRRSMVLIIAIVLAIAWLLGFTVFHVSAFAIHLLLVLALVAVIVHFARGRRPWVD